MEVTILRDHKPVERFSVKLLYSSEDKETPGSLDIVLEVTRKAG